MSKDDQSSKVAAGMSTAAAIMAALAWLKSGKAEAAPPGAIPEELMNLVIAIANSAQKVDENTLATVAAIQALMLEGGLGWPPNADRITTLRVGCAIVNTPYQLPSIVVPDDMQLLLLAWPLNPGWVFVGPSAAECTNINQSYPLPPGGTVAYRIKNADTLFVSANAVPAWLIATAEQRRG